MTLTPNVNEYFMLVPEVVLPQHVKRSKDKCCFLQLVSFPAYTALHGWYKVPFNLFISKHFIVPNYYGSNPKY